MASGVTGHTVLGNALGNADNQGDLSSDGLFDTGGGDWRSVPLFSGPCFLSPTSNTSLSLSPPSLTDLRYEYGGGGGSGLLDGLGHIFEDREAQMLLASLFGVCTSNNLGTYRKTHTLSDGIRCETSIILSLRGEKRGRDLP